MVVKVMTLRKQQKKIDLQAADAGDHPRIGKEVNTTLIDKEQYTVFAVLSFLPGVGTVNWTYLQSIYRSILRL